MSGVAESGALRLGSKDFVDEEIQTEMMAMSDCQQHQLHQKHEGSMTEVTGWIVCHAAKHDNKLIIVQHIADKNNNKCQFIYYTPSN